MYYLERYFTLTVNNDYIRGIETMKNLLFTQDTWMIVNLEMMVLKIIYGCFIEDPDNEKLHASIWVSSKNITLIEEKK